MTPFQTFLSTLIGVLVTAAGGVVIARIGARSTREGQKMQTELDWRKQLNEEMSDLKESTGKEIAELRDKVEQLETKYQSLDDVARAMGGFLNELGLFELYGSGDAEHPEPPEAAAAYYNRVLWIRIRDMHEAERLRRQQGAQVQQ